MQKRQDVTEIKHETVSIATCGNDRITTSRCNRQHDRMQRTALQTSTDNMQCCNMLLQPATCSVASNCNTQHAQRIGCNGQHCKREHCNSNEKPHATDGIATCAAAIMQQTACNTQRKHATDRRGAVVPRASRPRVHECAVRRLEPARAILTPFLTVVRRSALVSKEGFSWGMGWDGAGGSPW